jgi:hypothetical protein
LGGDQWVSGACGDAAGVVVGRRAAEAEAEGLQRDDQGGGRGAARPHCHSYPVTKT